MEQINIENLEEKKTYLMEYIEMEDNEIEAMPKPRIAHYRKRVDYQLITIVKVENPFMIISNFNGFGNTVLRLDGNESFYLPSKDFLDKFKKEKRCRNCC